MSLIHMPQMIAIKNVYRSTLIICILKSSRFGYMVSSKAGKVVSLRFFFSSFGWLIVDELKEVFGKCTYLCINLGGDF